jgi:hypothetical protein
MSARAGDIRMVGCLQVALAGFRQAVTMEGAVSCAIPPGVRQRHPVLLSEPLGKEPLGNSSAGECCVCKIGIQINTAFMGIMVMRVVNGTLYRLRLREAYRFTGVAHVDGRLRGVLAGVISTLCCVAERGKRDGFVEREVVGVGVRQHCGILNPPAAGWSWLHL